MTIHDSPGDIAHELSDIADLMCVLLAQPDAETAIDGMHRVMTIMRERIGVLREGFEAGAE